MILTGQSAARHQSWREKPGAWATAEPRAFNADLQRECFGFPSPVELTGLDGPERHDRRNNLKLSSGDHAALVAARGLLMFWCAGA